MLDIKLIRENPELVRKGLMRRHATEKLDAIIQIDETYRALLGRVEKNRADQRTASEAVAKADGNIRTTLIAELKIKKEAQHFDETKLSELETELNGLLLTLPNLPSDDTPDGPDESGNLVIRTVGNKPTFDFEPKDHLVLGTALGIIDTETAANVSGTRFTYLKGDLALLQQALVNFVFDLLTDTKKLSEIITEKKLAVSATPFIAVVPPLMIRPEVFARMARLEPREERYHIPSDDVFLIGSAEHTLGPLHMDEMLEEKQMPLRYFAFTPAFRREAGAYGKDTHGILRLHQFDKIEMESFSLPETSRSEQDFFVAIQEYIVSALKIPYQVMQICTGDMGSPDSRQIDIECWMPGQNRYRETHTSDLMTDYQARRLATRVKRADGATQIVHTNDATAVAMGRTLIAIMENYQQRDGSIKIPDVLQKFMRGRKEIK